LGENPNFGFGPGVAEVVWVRVWGVDDALFSEEEGGWYILAKKLGGITLCHEGCGW